MQWIFKHQYTVVIDRKRTILPGDPELKAEEEKQILFNWQHTLLTNKMRGPASEEDLVRTRHQKTFPNPHSHTQELSPNPADAELRPSSRDRCGSVLMGGINRAPRR